MEGRKHGFCKDFSGRPHALNKTICEILYPKCKDAPIVSGGGIGGTTKNKKTTRVGKPNGYET